MTSPSTQIDLKHVMKFDGVTTQTDECVTKWPQHAKVYGCTVGGPRPTQSNYLATGDASTQAPIPIQFQVTPSLAARLMPFVLKGTAVAEIIAIEATLIEGKPTEKVKQTIKGGKLQSHGNEVFEIFTYSEITVDTFSGSKKTGTLAYDFLNNENKS